MEVIRAPGRSCGYWYQMLSLLRWHWMNGRETMMISKNVEEIKYEDDYWELKAYAENW